MAISTNGARFLSSVTADGVALGRLLTVGRQGLYVPKSYVNQLLNTIGRADAYSIEKGDPGYPRPGEWADELYRYFGATSVNVLDGSDYEGADLVHDLNRALPASMAETFDTLLDSGSLEHVFNVPEAISSYMKLVKVGGYIVLLDMPATNACGHGFYQFSPAFFWQVFAEAHGFEVVDMVVAEADPFSRFWRVSNPAQWQKRVELVHRIPCYLHLVARKKSAFHGFQTMPIQEDYAQSWKAPAGDTAGAPAQTGLALLARKWAGRVAPLAYWRFSNRRNLRRFIATAKLRPNSNRNPFQEVRL